MKTRDYHLIQIYNQYKVQNFTRHLNDFNELIELLNDLQDAIYHGKSAIKPWQKNLEVLIAKFSILCSSISQLSNGTKIRARGKIIVVYDIHSIYVLSRSLIESYLTINYLNHAPQSDEQGEFRNDLYALAGLSRRQEFETMIEEGKKKKAMEKREIEKLITKIKKNKYFRGLSNDRQKKILKDKPAKEVGWENLLRTARIQNSEYLLMWRLYSNYAHSEYLSSIQLNDYLKNSALAKETVLTSLIQNIVTLSILISDLTDNFLSARLKFNMAKQATRTKVEFWGEFGRGR
ncbi:MAG: DUF5677 domain-containing protein [Cyclobacteriaceae bacterium]